MKKILAALLIAAGIALTAATIYGVARFASGLLGPGQQKNTVTCDAIGTEYVVAIQGGKLGMNRIQAKACDRLTITNEDDQLRLMAFGVHDSHRTYNGVTEQTLEKGDSMSVVLTEIGSFTFHDHLNDTFAGVFTVQK